MKNKSFIFMTVAIVAIALVFAACPTEKKDDPAPAPEKITTDQFTLDNNAFEEIFSVVAPEGFIEIDGTKAELDAYFNKAKVDPTYKSLASESITRSEAYAQAKEYNPTITEEELDANWKATKEGKMSATYSDDSNTMVFYSR